jgi:tetratricopeptide (TPR) repeat protein
MSPAPRAVPSLRPVLLLVMTALLLAGCASPEDTVARHIEQAKAMMADGDYARAKVEARNAVQIRPKNAEANFILAQLAWREGKAPEAFANLLIAVESDPKLLEARLRLGDLYAATGDATAAAEQAAAARELAPERADVHLLTGRVLFMQGDAEGAEKEVDAALAANPAYVDAITSKAGLVSARGDNAGALAVLDKGITATSGADAAFLRENRLEFLLSIGKEADYEAGLRELMKSAPGETKYGYQLLDFYARRGRTDDELRLLRELVAAEPGNTLAKVRLARLLVAKEDPAGAELVLKDGLAQSPGNTELKIALGDLYRYENRSAEAMASYRQAASQAAEGTAERLQALNRIVAQHARDGNIAEARAEIAKILALAPDDPEALLSRATFAFLDRQYDAAIADLRNGLRRQKSPEAMLLLARCYVAIGDTVVAKDTYRRLLEAYPGDSAAARELAVLLSDQGDAAAAADILRNFVAAKPDDAEASGALVQSLLAQRDVAAAEAEARRLIERKGGDLRAEQWLGQVLQAKGSNDEALARYRAVLEKDPAQAEALAGLVNILVEIDRAQDALPVLEAYPKGDLQPSLLLGKVYRTLGDMAAARQVLEEAIAANPADARPHLALASLAAVDSPEQLAALQRGWTALPGDLSIGVFLASLLERQGNIGEAIAVYDAVLEKTPGDPLVANNLAALLLDYRQDKASLARALELAKPFATSSDPFSIDTLGWAYYRNGDYLNAVRELERAVAAEAGNPLLQYHLGKAYAAVQNPVSARQHLARALELGGETQAFAADARSTLQKLGN